jgi:hypothetical protein
LGVDRQRIPVLEVRRVQLTVTWEAALGCAALFGLVQGLSIWVIRRVVQDEIRNWARPRGECNLLHAEVDRRLERLEEKA